MVDWYMYLEGWPIVGFVVGKTPGCCSAFWRKIDCCLVFGGTIDSG